MIGLLMLAAAGAPMSAAVRFDLSCAEATAWAMTRNPAGTPERSAYNAAHLFYLGRLSGRDDETNWIVVELAEAKSNRRTENQYMDDLNTCMTRVTDKLTANTPHQKSGSHSYFRSLRRRWRNARMDLGKARCRLH